jgi:hypothetical protein
MGNMLMDSMAAYRQGNSMSTRSKMGRLALSVMMEKNSALREAHFKYAWFSQLLVKVLNNAPAKPSSVSKNVGELGEVDGKRIGKVRARARSERSGR